jgi:ankyrin repeat protein
MADRYEELLAAIAEGNYTEAMHLVHCGIDLNAPCDEGASPLFAAILSGDISLVRMMLEHGADPNFVAAEPAASIYTEKPLELAMQARFLMDWDKYHPIVKLLEKFGAAHAAGQVESGSDFEGREKRAREWQAR